MSWSPDGKSLVFVNWDPKTQSDLWILPLTGDRKPVVYLQSPATEHSPQISPDGHWIAYVTGRALPFNEIWVQSYPAVGTKWQVAADGATKPRWRADGKELFYASLSEGFWSVAVEPRGAGLTFGAPKRLFDSRGSRGFSTFHQPNNTGYHAFAVSSDGQRFVIPQLQSAAESADRPEALTVVLNWSSLSKK